MLAVYQDLTALAAIDLCWKEASQEKLRLLTMQVIGEIIIMPSKNATTDELADECG